MTITNIDINNVTITPALKYTHYGDVAPTISLAYGSLDTRANVGHVTRNIKIVSGPTSDWGYQLIVYATYQEITSTSLTGQLIVQGV